MKHRYLSLTLTSVVLFFLLSCHHSPTPPAGMTGSIQADAYMAAENDYAGKWLADYNPLLDKIKKEQWQTPYKLYDFLKTMDLHGYKMPRQSAA